MRQPTVLIVEDGDEYLENLSRFVSGPTYIQAHSGTEAIEILTNAMKLDEDNFMLHYNLGVAFGKRAMVDLDVSIEHWKRARRLSPDDPLVHRNVGIAFFTKGLLEEAS